MSKSNQNDRGVLFLSDKPAEAAKKIMTAATDNLGEIGSDPTKQPGVYNLMQILALLTETTLEETTKQWVGRQVTVSLNLYSPNILSHFLLLCTPNWLMSTSNIF